MNHTTKFGFARLRIIKDAARVAVVHPGSLAEALRIWRGLVPRSWWARAPYLPLPDRRWIAFRFETAVGGSGDLPGRTAIEDVFEWSAAFRKVVRARRRAAR